MPTELPAPRTPTPPGDRDGGLRNVVAAGIMLVATVALLCGKVYPPLPAYSLNISPAELQLSP